jgi:hypothetical protein
VHANIAPNTHFLDIYQKASIPISFSLHIPFLIQPRNEIILSPAKTINQALTFKIKTLIRKSKAYICTNKTFTHSFYRTGGNSPAGIQTIPNAQEDTKL